MITQQIIPANSEEFSWCAERTQNIDEEYDPIRKVDDELEEKIHYAIWKNDVLRATDNTEINIHVENGMVYMIGHLLSSSNRQRVEKAINSIEGVRGISSRLVMDDDLMYQVAVSLAPLERAHQCKFFTGVSHGVVVLNGEVDSTNTRLSAELCAASLPQVRGVINYIRVSGVALAMEDPRFLQPPIGKEICFLDGISGIVRQVVINPNNRRVIAVTIQGRFYNIRPNVSLSKNWPAQTPEQLLLIPMSVMGYLTNSSGFLTIASTDYAKVEKFDPALFATPSEDWLPPYPYCPADVLIPADYQQIPSEELLSNDSLGG